MYGDIGKDPDRNEFNHFSNVRFDCFDKKYTTSFCLEYAPWRQIYYLL